MATTRRILIVATAVVALTMAGFVAVGDARATNATRSPDLIVLQAKPTQKPKPAQKPKPSPAPTSTPRPTPKPTPKPTAPPTRAPVAPSPTVGLVAKSTPRATPTPAVGAVAPPSPSTTTAAALVTGSTLAPSGGVPLAAYPLLLGLMTLLAGLAFARRRRPGAIVAPATSLGRVATASDADLTAVVSTQAPPGEIDVPRWRRPSVVAARFETDSTVVLRAATVDLAAEQRAPSIFTDWAEDAGERMQVRFDGVPLLDTPDDALGRARTELNAGDEALVLEHGEIWTSVTTPAGLTGWVPSMVLMVVAEIPEEDDASSVAIEPATVERAEDQPSLESLLEAAAAARRAREERLQAIQPAQPDPDGPVTGRSRAKARKPSDAVKKPRARATSRTRSSARGT